MFLEHVDKQLSDDLALGFRIGLTIKRAEKELFFIRMDEWHIVVIAEHADDLVGLTLAQQAMVDKHTCQLVANRLVDQNGCNRAVNAAGKAANHFLIANLVAYRLQCLLAIRAHGPIADKTGSANEIFIKLRPFGGVMDFWMKLNSIEFAGRVRCDSEWRIGRDSVNFEPRRDGADMIAVAHPDLLIAAFKPAVQQAQ